MFTPSSLCILPTLTLSSIPHSPQTGGWTALHLSAENGDSATTHALIRAGANVHIKAKYETITTPFLVLLNSSVPCIKEWMDSSGDC